MKKARLLTVFILSLTFTLLFLTGCTEGDYVSSLSLKDHDPDSVIETEPGAFDFGSYTLVVSYSSGVTEELPLTEQMLEAGDHDITVSYGGQKYVFKLHVMRSAFVGIAFPEDAVFTYDGTPHTVEVEGALPANATVTYPNGNSFVNAGTYDVNAIVTCQGYVTLRLSTTVKVERAKYDMSGVCFESDEVVYDGNQHSVAVTGTLPKGVPAPTYTINGRKGASATDADVYTVTASFSVVDPNYESIPDMTATLTILPAVYDLKGLTLVFKDEDGTQINGLRKVYDGRTVTFEISDKSYVGRRFNVSYRAEDGNGNPVTAMTNAGEYTVSMQITPVDSKNYQPIEPIVRKFEIKRAQYDTTLIHFDSDLVFFDNKAHNILVSLPEGHDIKPEDIIYEYRLGDELLQVDPKVGVTMAGTYTVTAIFPVKNENYEQITSIQPATLKIEKQIVDISEIGFTGETKIEYSGNAHVPYFITWQEKSGNTESDLIAYTDRQYYRLNDSGVYETINGAPVNAGFYKCVITARVAEHYAGNYVTQNGEDGTDYTVSFEIYKQEPELPEILFSDATLIYTGAAQPIACEIGELPECLEYVRIDYRYENDSYLPVSGDTVVNAGYYRSVITVSIKDAYLDNFILPGGVTSLDFFADYEIERKTIHFSELGFNGKTEYTDDDYLNVTFNEGVYAQQLASQELQLYRRVQEGEIWYWSYISDPYHMITPSIDKGTYQYRVSVLITDKVNYVFENGATDHIFTYEFSIV